MTHQVQTTALDEITELLAEHGFDGLASAVTVLLNEVMKIERAHALGAAPYQRSEHRTGHARHHCSDHELIVVQRGMSLRQAHDRCGGVSRQAPPDSFSRSAASASSVARAPEPLPLSEEYDDEPPASASAARASLI